MGSLSEWWFSRFSDEWYDLTTTRAFLGGLAGIVLYIIIFVSIFVLASSMGMIPSERLARDSAPPGFLLGFLVVMLIAVLTGGGSPYRFHTNERFRELSTRFSFRTPVILGFFGFYSLLVVFTPVYAVWFAFFYCAARVLVYVIIYMSGRM